MSTFTVLRLESTAGDPVEVDTLEEPTRVDAWRTYGERYLHDERPGTLIIMIGEDPLRRSGPGWWEARRVVRSDNRLVPA